MFALLGLRCMIITGLFEDLFVTPSFWGKHMLHTAKHSVDLFTIEQLLHEARKFGSAFSRWTCRHKAALCAGIRAGLELADEVRRVCGVTGKLIAEWARSRRVCQLRDQFVPV